MLCLGVRVGREHGIGAHLFWQGGVKCPVALFALAQCSSAIKKTPQSSTASL